MDAVLDRLRATAFFQPLKEDCRAEIARVGCWHSLAGGTSVFEQGAPAQSLHFLLSGRLIVVRKNESGYEVVGYIRAGEPVGEMSLLSGEHHSASVFALRDSEILSIPREAFDALCEHHADFVAELARLTLRRAREPALSFSKSAPRIFALVASSRSIDIDGYAERLVR
ncbi:MAG: cyclic nucleotide-binding domain-containing protein, partial [Pseudomonadota bacterium]